MGFGCEDYLLFFKHHVIQILFTVMNFQDIYFRQWKEKKIRNIYSLKLNSYFRGTVKGTQDWEFFWLRFWNLRYFFVIYVKILRFYTQKFLIGPLLGEVGFFRVVLGLRRMKKNFELGQKFFFYFLQLWTPNMTQYQFFENSIS